MSREAAEFSFLQITKLDGVQTQELALAVPAMSRGLSKIIELQNHLSSKGQWLGNQMVSWAPTEGGWPAGSGR